MFNFFYLCVTLAVFHRINARQLRHFFTIKRITVHTPDKLRFVLELVIKFLVTLKFFTGFVPSARSLDLKRVTINVQFNTIHKNATILGSIIMGEDYLECNFGVNHTPILCSLLVRVNWLYPCVCLDWYDSGLLGSIIVILKTKVIVHMIHWKRSTTRNPKQIVDHFCCEVFFQLSLRYSITIVRFSNPLRLC